MGIESLQEQLGVVFSFLSSIGMNFDQFNFDLSTLSNGFNSDQTSSKQKIKQSQPLQALQKIISLANSIDLSSFSNEFNSDSSTDSNFDLSTLLKGFSSNLF